MDKLTQEQVSELSDYSLDWHIAIMLSIDCYTIRETLFRDDGSGDLPHPTLSYCNNWDDLMPLVVEHEVSIMFRDHKSLSPRAYHKSIYTVNKSPQRALAECLFLVLQANNKE